MMEKSVEKLAFNAKLAVQDAIAQLSQATGLSDQDLLGRMPLLKDYKGTVTLQNIGGVRAQVILDDNNDTTYLVNFYGDEPVSVETLAHDSADSIKKALL